jgi:hypothetical protein
MLRKNPVERRPQLQGGRRGKTSAQFFLILVEPDEFRMAVYPKRIVFKIGSTASSGTEKLRGFFHCYQSKTSTNIRIHFAFIIPRSDAPNWATHSFIKFNTIHTIESKTCFMTS